MSNLLNSSLFYLAFPNPEKGYALRSELTWTHYRLIMHLASPAAREYYFREASDQLWSSRQLERTPVVVESRECLVSPHLKPSRSRFLRKNGR